MGEEHELYGRDISEHEAGLEMEADRRDELEEMRKRLRKIEEEAAVLREMKAKAVPDPATSAAADLARKQEVDSRSVFVGNVDYSCSRQEVQQHFESCGTVKRVTIKTDKFGHPKGFAYLEFLETEAVQNALLLNQSGLHNRQLKVAAKRTNVPGMKQYRYRGWFNPQRAYLPPPPPYSQPYYYPHFPIYGGMPRFKLHIRY